MFRSVSRKMSLSLFDFNQRRIVSKDLIKKIPSIKFQENLSSGSRFLGEADWQTRQSQQSLLSNCCEKAPKKHRQMKEEEMGQTCVRDGKFAENYFRKTRRE
jgi:hypothetical protein